MGSRGQSSASRKKVKTISGDVAEGGLGHDRFSPQDAATDRMAEYLGVSEKEAAEFSNAIYGFTGDYCENIRAVQNNDTEKLEKFNPKMREVMEKYAQNVEKYISLAPKWDGGATHRGISIDKKDIENYKIGDKIDVNRGTASWSSSIKTAEDFAATKKGGKNPVVFSCDSQSKGTSIKHLSEYEMEDEVMVSKKAKYMITSIKKGHALGEEITYVKVKEVR